MKTSTSKNKSARTEPPEKQKFIEGVDFYFENGLMVLTAHYLEKRGYCCGNDCRHCPYQKEKKSDL